MSQLTITNTFTAGTTIASAQVNTNYTDISTIWNAHDAGTDEWQNVFVTATAANPVQIAGNAATTELSINNTAADGDPILTFELSGTTKFAIGVDDGDSDILKIGTTAIGTSTNLELDGTHVFFPDGTAGAPAVSWISDVDTGLFWASSGTFSLVANGTVAATIDGNAKLQVTSGDTTTPGLRFISDQDSGIYLRAEASPAISSADTMAMYFGPTSNVSGFDFISGDATQDLGNASNYWLRLFMGSGSAADPAMTFALDAGNDSGFYLAAANTVGFTAAGVGQWQYTDGSITPITNDDVTLGTAAKKWSDVQSTLINGADYGFANGWILREYPCTAEDIQTKSNDWMKEHANKGIQILNDEGALVAVIGRNGKIYASGFEDISKVTEL